jgi:hypothetical protein
MTAKHESPTQHPGRTTVEVLERMDVCEAAFCGGKDLRYLLRFQAGRIEQADPVLQVVSKVPKQAGYLMPRRRHMGTDLNVPRAESPGPRHHGSERITMHVLDERKREPKV